MDERAALNLLKAAIRKTATAEARAAEVKDQLYDVIRAVSPVLKQIRIAEATGWSREHIRNIVDGKIPKRPSVADES
jgi:hypothetical protein